MQFPISIELHRSRLLATLLVASHAGAIACVLVLPWVLSWRIALSTLIALSLAFALRRSGLAALHITDKGTIEGVFSDGPRTALTLLPETTVFRWLVVLRLRVEGKSGVVSVSVLPDQMPADDFRVLRLWLRWRAVAGDDAVRRAS